MEVRYPGKNIARRCALGATVGLIATLGWATSVLGATINQTDCDAFEKAAEPHESPVEALSISRIDHASPEVDGTAVSGLSPESAGFDSATPFLYLTPRVASVLQDIFETKRDEPALGPPSDDHQSLDSQLRNHDRKPFVSSPLADVEIHEMEKNADTAPLFEKTLPASGLSRIDREVDLPLLQRQMFRTDI